MGRIFERHVGLFYTRNGAPIKINLPGMSDLWMLIDSFHIEIECKIGNASLSKQQKRWRDMVIKTGHRFIEARSNEQVKNEIDKILKGELSDIRGNTTRK